MSVTVGMSATTDVLLRHVHLRLGLGIDIQTFVDETVEVRWKRDYDGDWSDERFVSRNSIDLALEAILEYEDEADKREREEKA